MAENGQVYWLAYEATDAGIPKEGAMRPVCIATLLSAVALSHGLSGETGEDWTWRDRDGNVRTKEELAQIVQDHWDWYRSDGAKGRQANLNGADLAKAGLSGVHLQKANLSEANLMEADLSSAHLYKANLSGANLEKTKLAAVDLTGANLSSANLPGADLAASRLRGANLSETNLTEADLSFARSYEANLSGANLQKAYLTKTGLSGANLTSANLSGADLAEAGLSGANLSGANLSDAFLGKALARGANLSFTRLYGANLASANLSGANLSEAILSGADLRGANLREANLTDADIRNARVEPADLAPAKMAGLLSIRAKLRAEARGIVAAPHRIRWLERKVTGAIEMRRPKGVFGRAARAVAFGWTCQFGGDHKRPLWVLAVVILVFSCPYAVAVRKGTGAGIWRRWDESRIRTDQGQEGLERVRAGHLDRAFLHGLFFSVLSAFHVGWRDLSVGHWLMRVHPKEYALQATGWVKTVSGIQFLITVYLVVLWVACTFGRPFG